MPSIRTAGAASRLGNQNWPQLLFAAFVFALIVNVLANAVWVAGAATGLKDLDSFLHSGAAYAKGLDPYEYYWWLRPEPISPEALNLNPPVSVYLFEPLATLDHGIVAGAFLLGSVAMVSVAVVMLMRVYPDKRHWLVPLLVAAMAGMWQMLFYLQIYAPLALAMTGAWLLLRRGDWLFAGILIGLVIAVKPNYGLVALVMVAAGAYRPAFTSIVTAGFISLIPLVIDGPGIYLQWLHLTQEFDGYAWTSNASLVSVGVRLGSQMAGQIAAGLLVVVILLLARRWRPDTMTTTALGTMCVILVGPVSWAGYTLMLLPYLFSIRWDGWTWAAVALLALPFAPAKLLETVGLSFGGIQGPVSVADSILPEPLLAVVGAVVMPLIAAIYAWAVIILLVRLCQRLAEAHGDRMPRISLRRRLPKRPSFAAEPRPAAGAERAPGAAVAVQVQADS